LKIGLFNTAFVGDVALMGRLVDALSLAGHEIVLFSNSAGCSLFQFDSRVKKTVVVKKQGGFGKIKTIFSIANKVRNEELDILLMAHKSFSSGCIAILSSVHKTIVFSGASSSQVFFSKAVHANGIHESARYLALANGLVSEDIFRASQLKLFGDVGLNSFLNAYPGFLDASRGAFFLCSPGSVWNTKRYPARLHADLLRRLLENVPNLRCVLSGGPSDGLIINEVLSELRRVAPEFLDQFRIVDASACLPLPELIELTRRASFVLTPDSAPLHIASATGTKTFAFFGPTSPETGFGPLLEDSVLIDHHNIRGLRLPCQPCSKHGHRSCPLGHHKCLSDLPADSVAARMLESLTPYLTQ